MTFRPRLFPGALLLTLSLALAQACDNPIPEDSIERCTDRKDNDKDGLTDCDDPNCGGYCRIPETTPARCSDGYDNNHDGLTDCDDPGCAALAVCAGGSGGTAGQGGAGAGGESGGAGSPGGDGGTSQAGAAGDAGSGGAENAGEGGTTGDAGTSGSAGSGGNEVGGSGSGGSAALPVSSILLYDQAGLFGDDLRVVGDTVYWVARVPSKVHSIKTDGTGHIDVSPVADSGGDTYSQLAFAGGYLFWTYAGQVGKANGWVARFKLPAGPADVITNFAPMFASSVAADESGVFWGTSEPKTLTRMALDGSTQADVPLDGGANGVPSIALDSQFVYWTEQTYTPRALRVMRRHRDGSGTAEVIVGPGAFTTDTFTGDLHVDGDDLFFWTEDNQFQGRILRVKKDGSAPLEEVATLQNPGAPSALSVDATHLYFSYRAAGTWGIWRIAKNATKGAPELFSGDTVSTTSAAIRVTSDAVYWLEMDKLFKAMK